MSKRLLLVSVVLVVVFEGFSFASAHQKAIRSKGANFRTLEAHEHTNCGHDEKQDDQMALAALHRAPTGAFKRRDQLVEENRLRNARDKNSRRQRRNQRTFNVQQANGSTGSDAVGDVSSWGAISIKAIWDPQDCEKDLCAHCTGAAQKVHTYRSSDPNVNTVECELDDLLRTEERLNYIPNEVMPKAISYLAQALMVRKGLGGRKTIRVRGPDPDRPNYCGLRQGVKVPEEHMTTGVDADVLLYVTASPAAPLDKKDGLIATATSCQVDDSLRPVVGHINFYPASTFRLQLDEIVDYAIHEIMHALGFNDATFRNLTFFDAELGSIIPAVEVARERNKTVWRMVTPEVRRLTRSYFGCSTLRGMELEDQGGAGTAGSHWEKRLLFSEAMVGVRTTTIAYFSAITLGYFEDTGWYRANYGVAETMYWGRQKGCSFVEKKCSELQDLEEFCFGEEKTTKLCTFWGDQGHCPTSNDFPSLPEYFQYYPGQPTTGGNAYTADFCPVTEHYVGTSMCKRTDNVRPTDWQWALKYGGSSMCFVSSAVHESFDRGSTADVRCMEYRCVANGYDVRLGDDYIPCPANTRVQVGGYYKGFVECPPYEKVCRGRAFFNVTKELVKECNFHGYLTSPSTCSCEEGYIPDRCKYTYAESVMIRFTLTIHPVLFISTKMVQQLGVVCNVDVAKDPDAIYFVRTLIEGTIPPPPPSYTLDLNITTPAPNLITPEPTPAPPPTPMKFYVFIELRSHDTTNDMIRAIGTGVAQGQDWSTSLGIASIDLWDPEPSPRSTLASTLTIPYTDYLISSESFLVIIVMVVGLILLVAAEWLMYSNNVE